MRTSTLQAREAASSVSERPRKSETEVLERVRRMASACHSVTAGFHVCAKYTKNPVLAEMARSMAFEQGVLADEVARLAATLGAQSIPKGHTSDRLRWEWLASTATVLDGTSDVRLLAECVRMMREACDAARMLERSTTLAARELRDDVRSLRVLVDRACVTATRLDAGGPEVDLDVALQ